MGKALPILGILGAVFASLAIAVLVPDSLAMFAPLLVSLAGSVVLLGQRSIPGVVAGIVVLGLTVLAALGLVGTVSTEGGGGPDLGVSVAVGQVLAVTACLALPLAAIGLRWNRVRPAWLGLGSGASGLLAIILVALDPQGIAQQNQADTLVAAVLALVALAAMVPLLRAVEPGPGPETPGEAPASP